MEMLSRMETGRFKVFKDLNDWFEEFRLYHRKDGGDQDSGGDSGVGSASVRTRERCKEPQSGVDRLPATVIRLVVRSTVSSLASRAT